VSTATVHVIATAGAECVSAPMEMSVAPASAYARAVSGVIPPSLDRDARTGLTGPPPDTLRRLVVGKNVGHAGGECGIQLLVALDFDDNRKARGDSSERLGERAWGASSVQ